MKLHLPRVLQGEVMEISKQWLKENDACSDGIELFEKNTITDVHELVNILIEGTSAASSLPKRRRLEWANWLLSRALTRENRIRYAVFATRQVLHIYEDRYPDDNRIRAAIDAAEAVCETDNHKTRAAADAAYAADAAADAAAHAAEWGTTMINILQYGLTLLE